MTGIYEPPRRPGMPRRVFQPAAVPCSGCVACCVADPIFLRPELGDDVAAYATTTINGRIALRQRADLSCWYLGGDGCTIHERKPAVCREFDCRLFLDPEAGAFLRSLHPATAAKVIDAAERLEERLRRRKARRLGGAIPGRKSRKARRRRK